ncbi:hypothetical protein L218DRAFT_885509 [Marasmius fiardii PR-910]|nr:hypothetical protein L218DRAFT_885509 [Marasmius fiardii PR-910]
MFTYKQALQTTYQCVTFLAQENVSKTLVVVKFVNQTSYGIAVHEFLADKGLAPKIYYGMYMVVMDYIELAAQPPANTAAEQVRNILNILHLEGFVFGDLCDPNIIFNTNDKAMLIDFDWAGKFD